MNSIFLCVGCSCNDIARFLEVKFILVFYLQMKVHLRILLVCNVCPHLRWELMQEDICRWKFDYEHCHDFLAIEETKRNEVKNNEGLELKDEELLQFQYLFCSVLFIFHCFFNSKGASHLRC